MYIAVISKGDDHVYRIFAKSFSAIERTIKQQEDWKQFNGVIACGPDIDHPEYWTTRVVRKGRVRKATPEDLACVSDEFSTLVKYAKKHGASDLVTVK